MFNGLHEIYFEETGQTLRHVPPVRVASANYSIEDTTRDPDAADRVIASGNATVDGYSATLNGNAGRGQTNPRRVPVGTPGSPTIGLPYAVIAADGRTESKTLSAIGATYLEMSTELRDAYITADTVQGLVVSAAFPDAAAADDNIFDDDRPLVVIWTYTLDGQVKIIDEQIRLSRSKAESQYLGAAELEFNELWEELVTPMRAKGHAVRQLARVCARWLSPRLRAKKIDPEDFMRGEQGMAVLIECMAKQAAETGHIPANRERETFVEERRRSFGMTWNDLVIGGPGHDVVDLDRDGVAKATQSQRYGRLIQRA